MVRRAPGPDATPPTSTAANPPPEPPRPGEPLVGSPVERLRPRTAPQILDAGFEVMRFRAGTITILLAVLHGPFFAASLWMTHHSGNGWFPALTVERLWNGRPFEWKYSPDNAWLAGGVLCALFGEMLFAVGLSTLMRRWLEGFDVSAGSILRNVGRRIPVIVLVWMAALVLKSLGGAICLVGLLLVVPHLSILAPVVAFERGNLHRWISRSRELVNRSAERALFLTLMAPVLSFLVPWGLQLGARQGIGDVEYFSTAMAVVVSLVLLVARSSATVLFYLDIRVRTEGLDLALRAPSALGPA